MAALFGTMQEFDKEKETWSRYVERLNHFFVANAVEDEDRKRAILLNVMGIKSYNLLEDLLSPSKPTDKSFKDLVQVLKKHYGPEPSEIVERYKFFSRVRQPGESVSEFIAQLRSLAKHCNF